MKFTVVGDDYMVMPEAGIFRSQAKHSRLIDDFKWKPGANVQAVWRRHGWTPPSEYREDYLFKHNREGN
jgi:Ni/Co efflux regulator RcnB